MRATSIIFKVVLTVSFISLITSVTASRAADCVFDQNSFNESTYSEHQLKSSVWIKESKELKAITQSNDLLSVKHWACNHIGFEATLLSNDSTPTSESTKLKILELGAILLQSNDHEALTSAIDQQKIVVTEENQAFNVENTGHQQFTVNYQYVGENLLIEVLVMDN